MPPDPMRHVAICALFRNSAAYIDGFRAMLSAQARPDLALTFSLVEGDSGDDSWARLRQWADADPRVRLTQRHVEPVTDFADRVAKWAMLGNVAVTQALATDCTHVLWCESDLTVPGDLLPQLLAAPADVVAPAVFLGSYFYDTWGFRGLDGERFANVPPYHREFRHHAVVPLSSVGSCVLFPRAVFDAGVRFRGTYDDGLLVGVCRDAAALGFRVAMDSRVAVLHPTSLWQRQQYRLHQVRLQVHQPQHADALVRAAQRVSREVTLTIGSLDVAPDHAVFAPVHAILREALGTAPFALGVALVSEPDKQFALVLSDLPAEVPT